MCFIGFLGLFFFYLDDFLFNRKLLVMMVVNYRVGNGEGGDGVVLGDFGSFYEIKCY